MQDDAFCKQLRTVDQLMSLVNCLLQATGVAFPEVTTFWQGEKFRCLGAGNRKKKIAFVGVKVREKK